MPDPNKGYGYKDVHGVSIVVGQSVRGRGYLKKTFEKVWIPGKIVEKDGWLLVEYYGPRPDTDEVCVFHDDVNLLPLEIIDADYEEWE